MTIGRLLNISQVADYMQTTVRTVYRMIESGEMPRGHYIRGSQRWYFEEIEQFVRFSEFHPKSRVTGRDT